MRPARLCMLTLLGAVLALPAQAAPRHLELIPRDGFAFLTVRVADLAETDVAQPLITLFGGMERSLLQELEQRTGLKITDIDRATLLFPAISGEPSPPVIIVTTKKPYDAGRVLLSLQALSPRQFHQNYGPRMMWKAAPPEIYEGEKAKDDFYDKGEKLETPPRFEDKPDFEKGGDFKDEGSPPPPPPFDEKKDDLSVRPLEADELIAVQIHDEFGLGFEEEYEPELGAPYYHMFREESFFLILLDAQTMVFLPAINENSYETPISLLAQLMRGSETGGLSDALTAAAGDHLVVAGVNLPHLNQILPKDLPFALLPLRTVLRAEGGTFTLDLGDELTLTSSLTYADANAAQQAGLVVQVFRTMAVDSMPMVREDLLRGPEQIRVPMDKLFDQVEAALKEATITTDGAKVTATISVSADEALTTAIRAATIGIEHAQSRTKVMNNFKQIGLAMHNYHDTFAGMPAQAIYSADGKPLLSWRVAILPFIEQENLYRQFRLDEPWDSEHNKALLDQMPPVYAIPGVEDQDKGMTAVQGFIGAQVDKLESNIPPIAMFPRPDEVNPNFGNPFSRGRRLAEIVDGTSNTLLAVEAANAVPWTKPEDIPFNPDDLPELGGHTGEGFFAVFGDGSVQFISNRIDAESLRRLICPNDGYPVDRYGFEE